MAGKLLKGREVTDALAMRTKEQVQQLKNAGIEPTLAIVRVGEKDGDMSYEKGANKRAAETGISIKSVVFPEDIEQSNLIKEIEKLSQDSKIHGILLFRPLPAHIDDNAVRMKIAPEKDIDGITNASMAGVFTGTELGFPPCTARACLEMLDYYNETLEGKKVVVVGRSLVVGRPLAMMLMKRNATITICHTNTKEEDLADICRSADILIVAAGKPGVIGRYHVNSHQTVIDVGINVDENGKLCGDVAFDEVVDRVKAITPVPGGVGGATTGLLMMHVVEAAKKQMGVEI